MTLGENQRLFLAAILVVLIAAPVVAQEDAGNLGLGQLSGTLGVLFTSDLDESVIKDARIVDGIVRGRESSRSLSLTATLQATTINCGIPCGPQIVGSLGENMEGGLGVGWAFKFPGFSLGLGVLWNLNEQTLGREFTLNESTTATELRFDTVERRSFMITITLG